MSNKSKSGMGIFPKIAKMIDFPADAFDNIPRVELSGDFEAVIYGCTKVIEYSEECVCLKTKAKNVVICGKKLVICNFTAGAVSVNGEIFDVRFDSGD